MAAPPPPAGGVVIEHKKGEVNELKASLRNPAIDRDPEKKREVIKRVIAYMTLGIDVSKLFSDMIMVRAPPSFASPLCWPEGTFRVRCCRPSETPGRSRARRRLARRITW